MIFINKNFPFFLLTFVFSTQFLVSQILIDDSRTNEKSNFFDIQKQVYDEWGDKSEKDIRGYKQFKRWEYFWYQRTFPTGEFPDGMSIFNNYKEYQLIEKNEPKFLSAKWKSLGPYREPTDPSGHTGIGRVNAIRFNPVNSSELWACSASGGLWKSTNNGTDWITFPFTQFLSIGISDVALSPSNPKIIYASTGDMFGSASSRNFYTIGLIKSTDGGNNWQTTELNTKLEDKLILGRVLVHPSNSNIVFVASNRGIFKTTDGGSTWKQSEKSSYIIDMEFKPQNSNVIYVSTFSNVGGASVFVSNDAGETWKRTLSISNAVRIAIATTEANNKKIYALAANTGTFGFNSLNVSTDDGNTWEKMSDASNSANILGWYSGNQTNDNRGQGFYDLAIAASPENENEIFLGGINIWKSINAGANFTKVSHWVPTKNGLPYIHADQHDLVFGPDKTTLYSTNDGGIDKTTNKGVNWTSLSQGLNITQYYRIGVAQTNSNLVICGAQDNGTSLIKQDNSWSKVNGSDGMECIIDPTNPQRMYSSIYNGSLYRSIDGGANFTSMISTNTTKESGAWVTPFVLNPQNPRSIYAGFTNIWKSDNYGASGSWKKISSLNPVSTLQALVIAPSDSNVIYTSSTNQLFATYDGGTTWKIIYESWNFITSIAVDFNNPKRIWITKSGYTQLDKVIELIDSVVVRNISGNIPNVPVNTIILQENSPDRLYIGTDVGVFVTDYNSGYWQRFGDELPNVIVMELEIQKPTKTLFASTYGRGLWSAPIIECSAQQPEIESIGKSKFCPGDSIILRASKDYPNYLWSTGEKTKEITVSKFGSYSLFVDDGNGCFGRSEQYFIDKSPFEEIVISSTEGEFLCPDGELTIIASPIGFNEYIWSHGEKNRETKITKPGYYSVTGISPDGCVVESKPVFFDVMPAPEKPVITQEGRVLIAPYATSYQWYLDGRRIFNSTSREHTIQDGKIGDYTVQVTNDYNCKTLSDPYSITTSVRDGIYSDFEVIVNNNPGSGSFLLNFTNSILNGLKISITDINGKDILTIDENYSELQSYRIDLSNYSNGIYFATIYANNMTKFIKLIKI